MKQKKILIIEDSIDLADSLEDMMRIKQYTTLIAPNGETGLELAFKEKPDLILLDLRLPDIDGLKVLEELRKDDWGNQVKVLILTASDFSVNNSPELKLGSGDILHKSHFGVKELTDRIETELV